MAITTDEPPRISVTSDTHFYHESVIKHRKRPFASVAETNKALNRVVRPQDTVIHGGGDFAFTRESKKAASTIINALAHSLNNGRKILILGNHDDKRVPYRECGFGAQFYSFWIAVGDKIFCHCTDWVNEADKCGRFIYYGHLHDNDIAPNGPNWKKVCVEWTGYTPVDITTNLTGDEYRIIVMTTGVNSR